MTCDQTTSSSDTKSAERFIAALASGLAAHGTPAHRLEDAVSVCAQSIGVQAEVFALPTAVLVTVRDEAGARTDVVQVTPGDINLDRLVQLDRVFNDVSLRTISPSEGLAQIHKIESAREPYGALLPVFSFALLSASAARMFGGGLAELAAAGLVGLAVGIMTIVSRKNRDYARVLEFVAGFTAVVLAGALGQLGLPISLDVVILAGVIFLVPGLTLTMSVTELATRNLVCGTARLVGALTILVSIGFGVAIGRHVVHAIGWAASTNPTPTSPWTLIPALAIVPPALAVLFRAKPRDAWVIAIASLTGFIGARAGAELLGPELGVCVGAGLVGIVGNLYARLLDRPAVVASVPGLLLLVPGGIGFQSFERFLTENAEDGLRLAFSVVVIATSLVAGLLLANVAVPPRKAL